MGLAISRLLARLIAKKEMRILMVRAGVEGAGRGKNTQRARAHNTACGCRGPPVAERSPLSCSLAQVGLDAAGKTTILYKLKLGEIVTTIPTIGAPPPTHTAIALVCAPS